MLTRFHMDIMQDKIIASHTCFGGELLSQFTKLLNVPDDLKWTIEQVTIYTHFQGITNNIYGFGRPFLPVRHPSTHISIHPYLSLPI